MNVGDSGTSATLLWVADHASKVNATKRERMAEADARTEQVEQLGLLKQKLAQAKSTGDTKDVQAAIDEIDAFLSEQKADGVENYDDLEKSLNLVKQGLEEVKNTPPGKTETRPTTNDNGEQTNWDANKKKWDGMIDDKTKAIDDLAQSVGQHDQIEIMRITTLDQSENRFYELGSNKIANDGKTVNALIGNIRV